MDKSIVLVGPRCVGKTSTGIYLAEYLNAELIDADSLLESMEGRSIKEIVEQNTWKHFRCLENKLIRSVTSNRSEGIIFALGGGAVAHEYNSLREENIDYLKPFGDIVLLMPYESIDESTKVISERIAKDHKSAEKRPALTDMLPKTEVLETLKQRFPLYMQVKDYVIYTGELDEKEVAEKIICKLGLDRQKSA